MTSESAEWDTYCLWLRRKLMADWPAAAREEWEERAAIKEHDGGIPREQAERESFYEIGERLGLII